MIRNMRVITGIYIYISHGGRRGVDRYDETDAEDADDVLGRDFYFTIFQLYSV